MIQIRRENEADRLNEIINHPDVRPFVASPAAGAIDASSQAQNPNNILLVGDHGACLFVLLVAGIYEVHTNVLPSGRGEWMWEFGVSCAHWIFTRSPAYEVLTRIPEGHVAARVAALRQGMRHDFVRPNGIWFDGCMVDCNIHSISVQDWIRTAPGLVDRGRWVHQRMHEDALALGIEASFHEDDENHNRYVGASIDMAAAGYAVKGVALYNRWAQIARHRTITLLSVAPASIRFDLGIMRFKPNGDIEIVREV